MGCQIPFDAVMGKKKRLEYIMRQIPILVQLWG